MRIWFRPNLIIGNWFWIQNQKFFLRIEFGQIKQKAENGECVSQYDFKWIYDNHNKESTHGGLYFRPQIFFKIHILPILNNGYKNRYSGAAEGGWTPLHLAAKYLHKDVCKLILGHVTDKNPIVDNIGKDTPQHLMFHAQCNCWRETKNFFE